MLLNNVNLVFGTLPKVSVCVVPLYTLVNSTATCLYKLLKFSQPTIKRCETCNAYTTLLDAVKTVTMEQLVVATSPFGMIPKVTQAIWSRFPIFCSKRVWPEQHLTKQSLTSQNSGLAKSIFTPDAFKPGARELVPGPKPPTINARP